MTNGRKTGKTRRGRASSPRTQRVRITVFARSLVKEWRRLGLPTANARVVVAVSGGADSVALLCALNELSQSKNLKVKLFVSHLDHGLRNDSPADAPLLNAS